jgi:hypothetical protein
MRNTISIFALFGVSTITLNAMAQIPPPPADETNAIVVLDKSGSMTADFSTTQSMWDVAKERAIEFLNEAAPNREYALWTYNGTSYTEVYSFADGQSGASLAAFIAGGGVDSPTSTTPLAMTVCAAVDELMAHEASKPATIDRKIHLMTDGLENATPSTDQCYGSSSTVDVYPNYDTGSWQKKMLNKLQTGDANTPGTAPFTVIIQIEEVFQWLGSAMTSLSLSAALGAASDMPLEGPRGSLLLAPATFSASQFFEDIAVHSGGTYTPLDPNQPGGPQLPQPGDANGDYCVNIQDYGIVLSVYGQTAAPGEPADLNDDRIVNYYDYVIVLQNWGEGC